MFRLLDKLATEKNSSAPLLYKSLIFTMIESSRELSVREHYFSNFSLLFKSVPSVPIGLLIEPLIKLMSNDKPTFPFNTCDFSFFQVLSEHPKLNINAAIMIADLLAKVYLNQPIFGSCIQPLLLRLITRYLQEDFTSPMNDFVLTHSEAALSLLLGLEKNSEEVRGNQNN